MSEPEDMPRIETSVKKPTALEIVERRAQERSLSVETRAAVEPKKMFLPGFDIGAMPNHLNRSSLIAPIARGRRKFHRQAVMVSRGDCVLEYTGEQLDEADGDIIMGLIFYAQRQQFGTLVPINRAELLRKIHRGTSKHDYEWLHRRIKALTEGTMFIEVKVKGAVKFKIGRTESLHIVDKFLYDDATETYSFRLDPRWVTMFSNREYSLIDWEKRMAIGRGQDMAKTLQRLIATSSDPVQRYALDWLREKMEYASPMRKFREAVTSAYKELERVGIIDKAAIQESTRNVPQLVLWLEPSA